MVANDGRVAIEADVTGAPVAHGVTANNQGMSPGLTTHRTLVRVFRASALALLATIGVSSAIAAQDRAPNRREVTLVARDYRFIPSRIDVQQDDLVRITFTSEGRPTSFAVDAYRILKRAGADKTITFEFRADQAGTFTFYCSLTSDSQCRDMKGAIVVAPK